MGREDLKARRAKMRESRVNLVDMDLMEEEDSPLLDAIKGVPARIDKDKIYYFKYSELTPYPDDKIRLKLHTGEKRESLKKTIEQDGILDPILVWSHDGVKYIMAGHNRADIGNELGLDIPCLVFDKIDRAKADRIVVVTNLYNRQHKEMKPSELSNMLATLIDSYEEDTKENIYSAIDNEFNLSKKQILMYLRLRNLKKELMDKVDNGDIAVTTGYVIASFDDTRQDMLYDFITRHNIKTINGAKVESLKTRMIKPWDEEYLCMIFGIAEKKKADKRVTNVKVKIAALSAYLYTDEMKNSEQLIVDVIKTRSELKKMVEEGGREYSDELLMEAVKAYLEK